MTEAGQVEYIKNLHIAKTYPTKRRDTAYGTILYKPTETPVVDFGTAQWPRRSFRELCCEILLITTWTDFKWGFVGGGIESNEEPTETLCREFQEETGTLVNFSEDDFCFAVYDPSDGGRMCYIFAKVIDNRQLLQTVVQNFHVRSDRPAYQHEVFSIAAMPLFLEGGKEMQDPTWSDNTFGLSRYLGNFGGAFSATLNGSHAVRQQFLVLLLYLQLIDLATLTRTIALANRLPGPPIDLPKLLQTPGVNSLIS